MNRGQRRIFVWAVLLAAAVLSFHSLAAAQSRSCVPVSKPPESFEGLTIKPGKYKLTLVEMSGAKRGAAAHGDLVLIAASAKDVSPATGRGPHERENLRETPLYGGVSLDFKSVNAPVSSLTGKTDPIYPDVLVRIIDFRGIKGQPVLVIGSQGNRRDGTIILDGSGIGLFVQAIDGDGFSGVWDAWGIQAGGSGYFCAHAVPDRDK